MWWLWLIPAFFMALLLALLLTPLQVEIDTERGVYEVRLRGFFALWVTPTSEGWHWYLRVFFWKIALRQGVKKPPPQRKIKKRTSTLRSSRRWMSWRQMKAMLTGFFRAITVKRLWINWDTDDVIWNAWLFPVFYHLSGGARRLRINYSGQQEVSMLLQTRLGLLVGVFLRAFLKSK